jgi:hypothetical protein
MTIFKIFTPNKDFTGERAGVIFTVGFGVTSDQAKAGELQRMGYHVTEVIDLLPEIDDPPLVTQSVKDSVTDPLVTPAAPIVARPADATKRTRTKRG